MASPVYFIDLRATTAESFLAKLARLLTEAGLADTVKQRDLVAVKLHFGEAGNTAFIRPVYIRQIIQSVKALQGVPFLTDANTLYAGTRGDTPHHLTTAIQNGFDYAVVEAPLVIADGLRGKSETAVEIKQQHFDTVYIGTDIVEADALLSVAHFKGHELSGFGGTIKNVGMGCASRRGKLAQHSTLSPQVEQEQCVGCGECVAHCAHQALALAEDRAQIDPEACVGCGECILICPEGAIQIKLNQSIPVFMENMVEYTQGVLQGKSGKALFVNFILNVSPACDCMAMNDAPIVGDIGVVASRDPVAIDQASVDLVNREPAVAGSALDARLAKGEDKFKALYPQVDGAVQLAYAQQIGLGTRRYDLVRL